MKALKIVVVKSDGDYYRVAIYPSLQYPGKFQYVLRLGGCEVDSNDGYHSQKNAIQEAKSSYFGIDY